MRNPYSLRVCSRVLFAGITTAVLLSTPARSETPKEADTLFANQNWPAAEEAYEALLAEGPLSAGRWFKLGRARHEQGNLKGALAAYGKAETEGFQAVARLHYHAARVYVTQGEESLALERLEAMAKAGGPNHRVILNTPEFSPLAARPRFQTVVDALRPCNTAEYRQFDFWLGEWQVKASGAANATARNVIAASQDGCVITEQYTAGAFTGMSLNFYDAAAKKWHQTWMSNNGAAVYLEGGLNKAGEMQLSDADLPASKAAGTVNRVTWTPNADGTVRQHWQVSQDGGTIWLTRFDGLYLPADG